MDRLGQLLGVVSSSVGREYSCGEILRHVFWAGDGENGQGKPSARSGRGDHPVLLAWGCGAWGSRLSRPVLALSFHQDCHRGRPALPRVTRVRQWSHNSLPAVRLRKEAWSGVDTPDPGRGGGANRERGPNEVRACELCCLGGMEGRGSVGDSATALSEWNEDIRRRISERTEGFQLLFVVFFTSRERAEGFPLFSVSQAATGEQVKSTRVPVKPSTTEESIRNASIDFSRRGQCGCVRR